MPKPDVIYVPTPQPVVDAMLELAEVKASDIVYDLGSGDGRIVITAAKKYGARGVGIEIDPALVKKARENAAAAGVGNRVRFVTQDLFTTDLRPATVVTLVSSAEHQRTAASETGARAETGHAGRVARLQHGAGVAAGKDRDRRPQPHLSVDASTSAVRVNAGVTVTTVNAAQRHSIMMSMGNNLVRRPAAFLSVAAMMLFAVIAVAHPLTRRKRPSPRATSRR